MCQASLKDRLDEAWQSIKLGLVRAVSIGFQPIKYAFLKDGSGMEFSEWEWLELSAVTIPANSEATINIIRSIDSEVRAKATVPAPNPKESQGDYMDRCTTELTSNGVLASAASTTCSQMWDSMMGKSAGQFGPEVPGPEDGETAQEFMDRCQSTMSGSGLPADSIAMACGNMWDGAMMPSAEGSDQGDTAGAPLKAARTRQVDLGKHIGKLKVIESPSIVPTKSEGAEINLKTGATVIGISGKSGPIGTYDSDIIHPGATGKTIKPVKTKGKKHMAKKTIAEQISAFENTRGAKDARMRALMDEASENDVTLDQEQQEEYDTLEGEVSQVDAHLVRLRKMAESNVQQAKPVEGQGSEQALVTRGAGIVSAVRSPVPPGIGFARMAICMMNAYKHHRDAALVARSFYPNNPEVELALSQKATAVDPGDTTTGNWAPALVLPQNLAGEFVEFLRPLTLIGRVPGFRTVPFNVKIPTQTGGTSGHWVGEGQPKPVGALSFDTITLRWSKVAGIVAFTDELGSF